MSFGVWGSGFEVLGFGFRVQGLGFVEGSIVKKQMNAGKNVSAKQYMQRKRHHCTAADAEK